MKMNKRSSRKKILYSKSDSIQWKQSQNKARSTTLNNAEDEEDTDDALFEKLPSPTFNIHIHVPCYDPQNSKFFLPKIQPIVNLHFDELARKIESNRNIRNKKSLSKTFQNLLTKISPKFGVVKFHFKNDSEEKDTPESNLINVTPNSSRRQSSDVGSKKSINSEKSQNVATVTSGTIVSNNDHRCKIRKSDNYNNCDSHVLTNYELDKDIKLKKAVVLLTDISKMKNYKHFFESHDFCKNQSNENESSGGFADTLVNNYSDKQKYEAGTYIIKTENESCTPKSITSECNKNDFDISENCGIDGDINLQTEEDMNNKSHPGKISSGKDQNFTSLVEGWSFSDILNRFQIKYSEKLGDCATSSNGIIGNRINNEMNDNNKISHELNKRVKKNNCVKEEDFEEEPVSDKVLPMEISKNEINYNEKNCLDENVSDSAESFSFLQYQNETVNDFLTAELDVSEDSMNEYKNITKGDIEPELASDSNDSGSDECKIISGKEMSSKGIMDVEVVEYDLSSIRTSAVQENKFEVPEMSKSNISDVTHPRFHLELIEKEMQRRALVSSAGGKTQQNLKSKKSNIKSSPSGSTPSPKKMKLSNKKLETPERRKKESSQAEDFIRLNSSGSTEFFVASLNEIRPSIPKAKDFKKNMLFGDRVKRYSSPDQLRIYQLKQDAARNSKNY